MALLFRAPWDWQDERKQTEATRVLQFPRFQLILKIRSQHKVSWSHQRLKHWHQLYLILTRLSSLKNVRLPPLSLIPESGLRYGSIPGVHQDEYTDKEVPTSKKRWKTKNQYHQYVPAKPTPTLCHQPREGTWFSSDLKLSDATKTWETVRKHKPKCAMVTLRKNTLKSQTTPKVK